MKSQKQAEESMLPETSGEHINDSSVDIFRLPMKTLPDAVDEAVDNMSLLDKKRLRREMGIPSLSVSHHHSTQGAVLRLQTSPEELAEEMVSKSSQVHLLSNPDEKRTVEENPKTYESPLSNGILEFRNDTLEKGATQMALTALLNPVKEETVVLSDTAALHQEDEPEQEEKYALDTEEERQAQKVLEYMNQRHLMKIAGRTKHSIRTMSSRAKLLTIDNVAEILQRPHNERDKQDYEDVHNYMVFNVKFFQSAKSDPESKSASRGNQLSREDKLRLYEVMMYKVYGQGEILCEYGTQGDRFYIILEGEVGVRIPNQLNLSFDSTWDVFCYVLKEYECIRQYKDDMARDCQQIIKIFGRQFLRDINFTSVKTFVDFLKSLFANDSDVFETYPDLVEALIRDEQRKINGFIQGLVAEYDRIEEKISGSVSKPQQPKDKHKIRIQYMEHVNQLIGGYSFGQDALISEQPRNATCYVMSKKVITAVLTKNDFRRILQERERQHIDQKINTIVRFDLFKNVAKRRLKNIYRFFYDAKTQEPYVAGRNQFLYRQGDAVNGVFCIIEGQVKRIKETWKMQGEENGQQTGNNDSQNRLDARNTSSEVKPRQNVVNELRRNKAKQIVLTILQEGEALGIEEIVMKCAKRQYSMQVSSDECKYLFLSARNFREKFFDQSQALKHTICDKLEMQDKFIEELETKKKRFNRRNVQLQLAVSKPKEQKSQQKGKKDEEEVFTLSTAVKKVQQMTPTQLAANSPKRNVPSSLAQLPKQANNLQSKSPLQTNQAPQNHVSVEQLLVPEQDMVIESNLEKLEREIQIEIDKTEPDLIKLVQSMRDRRKEIAVNLQEETVKKVGSLAQGHLSSQSKQGKMDEQSQCRRYNAISDHQKQVIKKVQKEFQQVNIEQITDKMVKDAQDITSKWQVEKREEEYIQLILNSLSSDKRVHRCLRAYNDKLTAFIEYVREQGPEFIKSLGVPAFQGSLLVEEGEDEKTDKKSDYQSQISSLKARIREKEMHKNPNKSRPSTRQENSSRSQIKIDNRLRNLMITPVVGGNSSSTLALPGNTSRSSKRQKSSIRGGSRESNRGNQSRISSTRKTLGKSVLSHRSREVDESPEKLDIMKVFHEWYQSAAATLSTRKNKSYSQTPRQSAVRHLDKTTVIDQSSVEQTTELAQMMHQQDTLYIDTGRAANQPKQKKRAVSQMMPSFDVSTFSVHSFSRDHGCISPSFSTTPVNHIQLNTTQSKALIDRHSRTIDMTNAPNGERISAGVEDQSSTFNLVKQQRDGGAKMQEKLRSPAIKLQITKSNTQKHHSKFSNANQLGDYSKQVENTIPEEAYRASPEAEKRELRKVFAEKKAVHEIVLIPLDQSLPLQDSTPVPITEPVTAKNRQGSIGFRGLGDENGKGSITLQDEEISPIGDANQHHYNVTGEQQHHQITVKNGTSQPDYNTAEAEYFVDIQSKKNNIEKKSGTLFEKYQKVKPIQQNVSAPFISERKAVLKNATPSKINVKHKVKGSQEKSDKQSDSSQMLSVQQKLKSRATMLGERYQTRFSIQPGNQLSKMHEVEQARRYLFSNTKDTNKSMDSKLSYMKSIHQKEQFSILRKSSIPQNESLTDLDHHTQMQSNFFSQAIKTIDLNSQIFPQNGYDMAQPHQQLSAPLNPQYTSMQYCNSGRLLAANEHSSQLDFKAAYPSLRAGGASNKYLPALLDHQNGIFSAVGKEQAAPGQKQNSQRASWVSPLAQRKQRESNFARLKKLPNAKSAAQLPERSSFQQQDSAYQITNIKIASLAGEIDHDQYKYARNSTRSDQREKLHFDASAASEIQPQGSQEDVDYTHLASKMKMQGFVPTTKVKKDLRNSTESQLYQRSTPQGQNYNLTSNKSEANLRYTVKDARQQSKQEKHPTPLKAVLPKNRNPQSKKNTARPASKRSTFARNMFNPNAMSKNLQQQTKQIAEKKENRKILKIESKEYQKFTDRMIQDLQLKAKVQSSKGNAYFEPKPAILGHQKTAGVPTPRSALSFQKSASIIGPNHYMYNSVRESLQKTPGSGVQVNLKSKVSNAYASGEGHINSSMVNLNDKSMRSTVVESSLDPVFK